MQGGLPDLWRAEGPVLVAGGSLAQPAPVLGSVPRSYLPHDAGPQPVGGSGSHAGQTERCCWRLSEDWGGEGAVMRVRVGHPGLLTSNPPPPPHKGEVESGLPGDGGAGGGAAEGAPGGRQGRQLTLLQLLHQLFLRQATGWGARKWVRGARQGSPGKGRGSCARAEVRMGEKRQRSRNRGQKLRGRGGDAGAR